MAVDEISRLTMEVEAAMEDAKRTLAESVPPSVSWLSRDVARGPVGNRVSLIHGVWFFETREEGAAEPEDTVGEKFFCVDDWLTYTPFFADFGPLNLGKVYRFCERVDQLLGECLDAGKALVLWTSDSPHRRTNAAFLAGSYLVARCRRTAEDAFTPFIGLTPPLAPFRDAAFGLCSFRLSVLDCLRGLEAGIRRGFFNFDTFDIDSYENDEELRNGDINWIVPGLFVAFSGPLDQVKTLADGNTTWGPESYARYFRRHGVSVVVRLNKACYDRRTFLAHDVQHVDLFYPDGGLPPQSILDRFLRVCEQARGAIGVHCKAGLGRTGTCIGAYLMKHYRMSAREVIAWCRICRPGSVLGPQQQYLETLQGEMWTLGERESLHEAGDEFRDRSWPRPRVRPRRRRSPTSRASPSSPASESSAGTPATHSPAVHRARPHHRLVRRAARGPRPPGGEAAAGAGGGRGEGVDLEDEYGVILPELSPVLAGGADEEAEEDEQNAAIVLEDEDDEDGFDDSVPPRLLHRPASLGSGLRNRGDSSASLRSVDDEYRQGEEELDGAPTPSADVSEKVAATPGGTVRIEPARHGRRQRRWRDLSADFDAEANDAGGRARSRSALATGATGPSQR